MEEKKNKISLSVFISILAVLVIIIMAGFIYMQKINSDREISGLKNDAEELKATVTELQGKLDNISDISSTNEQEKVKSQKNNTSSNTFSDTEIKNSIQRYLNLMGLFYGAPESILGNEGLGFEAKDYYLSATESISKTEGFLKTNIHYSKFKDEIYKYMTENCFNSNYSEYYLNEDGYLCYKNIGATGAQYTLKNYTVNGNKYNAVVAFSQEEYIRDCEFEFEIVNNNGNVVIDYCNQTQP